MDWKQINSIDELEAINKASELKPQLIFKHSTRCSISSMAWSRLQRSWNANAAEKTDAYYLDLIAFRNVSNQIQDKWGVEHQSPQVLVIKNGRCIYNESHYSIDLAEILQHLD